MKGLLWDDEPYVKLYTRETADWMMLPFEARGLFCLLLRIVDRSGRLLLGEVQGDEDIALAVSFVVRSNLDTARAALADLMKRRFVVVAKGSGGTALLIPDHVAAQTARSNDRIRQQRCRERARDEALSSSQPADVLADRSGSRHTTSHGVTNRSDQRDQIRSDEKRSDPSPTGEGVRGGNQGLEVQNRKSDPPPTDRSAVSMPPPAVRNPGSAQLAILDAAPEDPPRKSQPRAKAAPKPRAPKPPPASPPTPKPLNDAERVVAAAIREDETLGRITRNIEQLARDLVRCCPLVDLVLEIRNLGAYTRTPKGMAKRYTDGNRYLLGNLQRRQQEQAERQAHLEALKQPPPPVEAPPAKRRAFDMPPYPEVQYFMDHPEEAEARAKVLGFDFGAWRNRKPLDATEETVANG